MAVRDIPRNRRTGRHRLRAAQSALPRAAPGCPGRAARNAAGPTAHQLAALVATRAAVVTKSPAFRGGCRPDAEARRPDDRDRDVRPLSRLPVAVRAPRLVVRLRRGDRRTPVRRTTALDPSRGVREPAGGRRGYGRGLPRRGG